MTNSSDPSKARTPDTSERGDPEQPEVPMFRSPSAYTPGRREPCYSPHQFFAVTQVGTDPEDDPALWLTEEKIDVVHREGILLMKQYFYHRKLDQYVTGKTKSHKRPDLVVRYNRALLARHVLDEVVVYLREPNGCYREICRARPREHALAEVDDNLALSYQKKYQEVLAKKRTKAQEAYLNEESGPEAVARFRERSEARAERQKRSDREPMVAAPIDHARDPVDPALQKVADEATNQDSEDPADRQDEQDSSSATKKRTKKRRVSSRKSKGLSAAQKGSQGAGRSGEPGPTVEDLLGGQTGFEKKDDD
jgi:hypothetical protein